MRFKPIGPLFRRIFLIAALSLVVVSLACSRETGPANSVAAGGRAKSLDGVPTRGESTTVGAVSNATAESGLQALLARFVPLYGAGCVQCLAPLVDPREGVWVIDLSGGEFFGERFPRLADVPGLRDRNRATARSRAVVEGPRPTTCHDDGSDGPSGLVYGSVGSERPLARSVTGEGIRYSGSEARAKALQAAERLSVYVYDIERFLGFLFRTSDGGLRLVAVDLVANPCAI